MLRVGFAGCGGANQAHARNLSEMEGIRLAAFQDVEEERAESVARQFGGRAYSDGSAMLAAENLDALFVALPPAAHGIELEAARKGIHLFIEKPVALSMKLACEIAAALEQAGVVCSVGYHFRYLAASQRAREILADRSVGMALGYCIWGLPGHPLWWRQKALSGGQAVEQTTHIFDLARWLVGEIKEVYALHATRALQTLPGFDVWDVGTVGLRFENGAIGSIHSGCLVEHGFRVGLDLFCKDFVLILEANRLCVSEPGRKEELTFGNDPKLDEERVFIEAVKSGNREGILSPYWEGVKTLAVTLAANRSAEEGRPVKIEEMFCA